MSTIFSRSRSQAGSSASGQGTGQVGCLMGGHSASESRSTFSKMRKKRPPPINISVEHGNVVLTTAAPASGIIYTDVPWSPLTPVTPHTIRCSNPACKEQCVLMISPTLPSHFGTHPSQQTPSKPQTSTDHIFPTAELPGSHHDNGESAELDAPSTPVYTSFDRHGDRMLESPPDLTPSSVRGITVGKPGVGLENEHPKGRSRNGMLISSMNFEELMDILPHLSPEEIKEFWQPAMAIERLQIRRQNDEAVDLKEESNNNVDEEHQDLCAAAELERIKVKYNIDLKNKENEICELLEFYHTQIGALCDFICERVGSDFTESTDFSLGRVQEIIQEHQLRVEHPDESGRRHVIQSQLIQDLQAHIVHLENQNTQQERRLREYRGEIELLQEEVSSYKKDEQRRVRRLREKDAQIAALNGKVAQLLTIGPTLFPRSVAQRIEKDLPSPLPCNWKRAEELKQQMMLQHASTAKATSNFPGTVETLEAEDDDEIFPIYKVDV